MRKSLRDTSFTILANHYPSVGEFEESSAVWLTHVKLDISKRSVPIGPKVLPYFHLVFILDGQGEFVSKGKKYSIQKSDVFCVFPEVVFEYCSDAASTLKKLWITFDGPFAEQLLERIGFKPCTPYLANKMCSETSQLLMQLLDICSQSEQPNADLKRLIIFQQVIDRLSDSKSYKNQIPCPDFWLQQAKNYIDRNYLDRLTISQVATYVHIERSYFSKKFTQTYGMPPAKYLQNVKIAEAKRQLWQTKNNQAIIANSIGYSDMFTFSKVFKKITGMSPGEYRSIKQSDFTMASATKQQ